MVKVLVVDDSVFMRTVIRDMLKRDPSFEVVGTASDGLDALEKIKTLEPDIVTLDIEMPKMNGLEVLKELRLAKRRPKILMLSSLTSKGAEMTTEAIRLGADDFMLKPTDLPRVREIGDELAVKIRHLLTLTRPALTHNLPARTGVADRVVIIGSSVGGPPMLDTLLSQLPGRPSCRYRCHPAYAGRLYRPACREVQTNSGNARKRDRKRGSHRNGKNSSLQSGGPYGYQRGH